MKKIVELFFVFSFFFSACAQLEPKHTFNVEVGIPVPVANPFFKGVMKSVVNISPYYQYRLKSSLAFGVGVNYSHLQIDKFKIPNAEPVKGGMHSGGVFLKVSHEKFHNEQFATDFGVKFGYNKNYFETDYNDTIYGKAQTVNSFSVTPTLGFILSVDEFTSYRFTIAYAVNNFGFSPSRLGMNTNGGFDPSKFSTFTQCAIFGFGFTHYFSKNKPTD